VAQSLDRIEGVRRLVRTPAEASAGGEMVFSADVTPAGADQVMAALGELRIPPEDYLLAHLDVIAPGPTGPRESESLDGFAWVTVMGEARANSRPLGRYLALMGVAGVIAALGVVTDNPILIVGAMAVSPDLLPICSTCVGIVGGRPKLASRAFGTLCLGLLLAIATALAVTLFLEAVPFLPDDFDLGEGGLGSLANVDYSTVLVALAAGVAGILAFETKAGQAIGVAISVTTIPASAYMGVAFGAGELSDAGGAALVLAVNVAMLILSGSLTLGVQTLLTRRAHPVPIE
jgi:uncharacterized hydrophobic protein (TIGR00271 family)